MCHAHTLPCAACALPGGLTGKDHSHDITFGFKVNGEPQWEVGRMEENELDVPFLPPLNLLQPGCIFTQGPLTLSSMNSSLLALAASPAHVSSGLG